jgi:hypothetical protein
MLRAGKDLDGGLAGLFKTLQIAGVLKIVPWIGPFANLLPTSSTPRKFRDLAGRLFLQRYKEGPTSAATDVFTHLVCYFQLSSLVMCQMTDLFGCASAGRRQREQS